MATNGSAGGLAEREPRYSDVSLFSGLFAHLGKKISPRTDVRYHPGLNLESRHSAVMSKASLGIDNNLLGQPRNLRGTSSIRATIHCALLEVERVAAWRQEVEALVTMDRLDLADKEIMKNVWPS